jgi:hypothetical protein
MPDKRDGVEFWRRIDRERTERERPRRRPWSPATAEAAALLYTVGCIVLSFYAPTLTLTLFALFMLAIGVLWLWVLIRGL